MAFFASTVGRRDLASRFPTTESGWLLIIDSLVAPVPLFHVLPTHERNTLICQNVSEYRANVIRVTKLMGVEPDSWSAQLRVERQRVERRTLLERLHPQRVDKVFTVKTKPRQMNDAYRVVCRKPSSVASAILTPPDNQTARYSVYESKKQGMSKRARPNLSGRAKKQEVKALKTSMERRIRHRSRAEQSNALPKVKDGRLLDDEQLEMD